MIQHDGLTNAILGSIKDRELTNKDIALQYASMTFDTSVFETWSALSGSSTCASTYRYHCR